MRRRRCAATTTAGMPCRAAALHERPYCRMHDPDLAEAVAEARRLGGLRRRRDATVHGAFDMEDLRTHEGLQRLYEVAVLDTLQLDNGLARNRTLIAAVSAGARLLDRDLEERIATLERRVAGASPSWKPGTAIVDRDPDETA